MVLKKIFKKKKKDTSQNGYSDAVKKTNHLAEGKTARYLLQDRVMWVKVFQM